MLLRVKEFDWFVGACIAAAAAGFMLFEAFLWIWGNAGVEAVVFAQENIDKPFSRHFRNE